MRNEISFYQFFISLAMGIYSFIMIVYFELYYFKLRQFLFMTNWNFYISTIYLIGLSICDFSSYVFKSKKLEKLNKLFRENLSPAFTALTYLVTFTFLVMIYPVILKRGDKNFGISAYINIYVHLILTIMQTIDIFLSYRKKKGILIKYDFLVASFIIWIYSILVLILVFIFDFPIYPFLDNMTLIKAFFEIILFQSMIFIFYLIHVGLIKLKYILKIFIVIDDTKKEKLK